MDDELLRITYPDRYLACGECAIAIALASKFSTSTLREIAAQNRMGPNLCLRIHCVDRVNSQTSVPDPKRQTAMQAQLWDNDRRCAVGLTNGEIIECPDKAARLSPQKHQLPNNQNY